MTQPRIGRPQPSRSTDDVLAMIDRAVETPFRVGQQTAGDASYGTSIDVGLCWRCLQADADPASPSELCASCSSEVRSDGYVAPTEDPPDVMAMAGRRGVAVSRWTAHDILAMYLDNGPRRIVDDDPFAGLELTIFPRVGAVDRWARRALAWARALPRRAVQTFARDVLMRFAVWLYDSTTPPASLAAGWPIGGQRTAPSLNHWSAVVAPRQAGRTEAIHRVEVMQRIAASLGVPASIVGRVGRPADVVIIDDPPPRPEARSAMQQALAHYTQTFDEFVTQVAPDQEDADV